MEITNKNACLREKVSTRVVGFFIFFISLLLAFAGLLIVPVIGLFFAAPFLILSLALMLAPESKACRLLMGKAGQR